MKVLVIALQKDNKPVPATFELISAAKSLGGEISTALLGADIDSQASDLASRGAGQVLTVANPALENFNDEIFCKVLAELVKKHSPTVVLGPANSYGRALLARLAGTTGCAMTSEVTGMVFENNQLVLTRPCYGGSVIAKVISKSPDHPYFVTVRPKIFPESTDGSGEVIVETVPDSCFESRTVVKEVKSEATGSLNLAEADVVVSAGRGIRGPENVALLDELAKSLKAALGASRAVVDADWMPYSQQVGQTGRTVNPKLYIAVGISGAIQHLVGMRSSQYIVAINKDGDAPIFNVSSYGIVGDLFEIVPAMTKKFQAELGT